MCSSYASSILIKISGSLLKPQSHSTFYFLIGPPWENYLEILLKLQHVKDNVLIWLLKLNLHGWNVFLLVMLVIHVTNELWKYNNPEQSPPINNMILPWNSLLVTPSNFFFNLLAPTLVNHWLCLVMSSLYNSNNIYGLLTKREVKMGGILAKFFFCVYMDRDKVEVQKHTKKNEANIQPSWPKKLGQ